MKLSAEELSTLVSNCELNDYMRERIGSALCKSLYDSANSEEDYPGEYAKLYDASFYNKPDDNDIELCLNYIEEVLSYDLNDFELELDL